MALSDECGTAYSAMVARAGEPQNQSCVGEPVPMFQLVAGGNLACRDDVRQISAVASERGGSAGRTWDRHLPCDGAVLVEPLRTNVRR